MSDITHLVRRWNNAAFAEQIDVDALCEATDALVTWRDRQPDLRIDPAPLSEFKELLLSRFRDGADVPDDQLLLARGRAADAARRIGAAATGETAEPFSGDDWQALGATIRALLTYMVGRESAKLTDVCEAVWGDAFASTEKVHVAKSRANTFLAQRGARRSLTKPRGEDVLRWG
jgi:hypothetical protein